MSRLGRVNTRYIIKSGDLTRNFLSLFCSPPVTVPLPHTLSPFFDPKTMSKAAAKAKAQVVVSNLEPDMVSIISSEPYHFRSVS